MFTIGQKVQLAIDSSITGVVLKVPRDLGAAGTYLVFHDGNNSRTYYEDQLEPFQEKAAEEALSYDFAAAYTAKKFSSSKHSTMFSMNAGNIKFIPYQFRPLRKLINGERPRILVADEVGVGKTIETGIILKEYERRENVNNVIIVCPKELSTKWQREMHYKFDEDFVIINGKDFKTIAWECDCDGEWPSSYSKCIIGLETLRRDANMKALAGLADYLHFDMLIVDEAHHAINAKTSSRAAVNTLSEFSEAAVFLSATPIQLGSKDLYSLLNMLLPEEFYDPKLFEQMASSNKEINAAIRAIRNVRNESWRQDAAEALGRLPETNEWARSRYEGNKQVDQWKEKLSSTDPFTDEERISCLRDLEGLHAFSHVLNRTKRRDIGSFTTRDPQTELIKYNAAEYAFYKAAHDYAANTYSQSNSSYTTKMIMANIERLITSCLPAFAQVLEEFIARGQFSVNELSDTLSEEDYTESTSNMAIDAESLRYLASQLPEEDSKTKKLLELVNKTIDDSENGKLLIFSFFKHTLRYLKKKLQATGARVELIMGDTKPEDRDRIRDRFRLPKEDPDAIDILLSSEVGCEGLDYEFCSRMVNYDIPWNPMKIEQRIGRIDRFGQKAEKVRIYNFVTENTVEERVFYRCFERLGIFNSTIGDLEEVLGELESSLEEIAFDLNLSPEQQAAKAQAEIDNKIRLRDETRKYEEDAQDLFLLDMEVDDKKAADERDSQIALSRRMVASYLKSEFPGVTVTDLGDSRLKVRMFKADKAEIRDQVTALKKSKDVDPNSRQYKSFIGFLDSEEAQIVTLEFDGQVEGSAKSGDFASLAHPLVILAMRHLQKVQLGNSAIHIAAPCDSLPTGEYLFSCYEWEEKGYRCSTDLSLTVLKRNDNSIVELSKEAFEKMLMSGEASLCTLSGAENDALNSEIRRKQQDARQRLLDTNEDTIKRKLSTLKSASAAKISVIQNQLEKTTSKAIQNMQKVNIERQRSKFETDSRELKAQLKADILVNPFATGVLEVR